MAHDTSRDTDRRGDAGGEHGGLTAEEYDRLRRIAAEYLRAERPGHTLQPTALVNEAMLRLGGEGPSRWTDRTHFLATAARAMRRILVDHARARNAEKRGGGAGRHAAGVDAIEAPGGDAVDLIALDEALGRLEGIHRRQARVVELRFFGGLSVADTAELMNVSERTVEADWAVARAWLRRALQSGGEA